MKIVASLGSAFIIAASLCAYSAGPLYAAEGDAQSAEPAAAVGSATVITPTSTKPRRHHARRAAVKSNKADKTASNAAPKPAESDTAQSAAANTDSAGNDAAKADAGRQPAAMSPAIANANAQWPTQAPADTTSNMAAQADSVLSQVDAQAEKPATPAPDASSDSQVIASDQLNDLDRAATDAKPPLTLAKATFDTPDAAPAEASSDHSTWDKTSLIGKIFIACGGLLTMASAARMFMA